MTDLPLTVSPGKVGESAVDLSFLADQDEVKARAQKLLVIGTLLEKAVINDPYKALNNNISIPTVFVNQKLYGKCT